MTDMYWLHLTDPKPPISLNGRMHWAAKNRITQRLKNDVLVLARAARLPKDCRFADIRLVWQPNTHRRRDTDNATPTLKACIDGLVAYGLTEDDDSTHVSSGCEIGAIRKPPLLSLRIEVTP